MTAAQLAATSPFDILPLPPAFATIHLLVAESAIRPTTTITRISALRAQRPGTCG
jgi:hypothetical protein